MLIHGIGALHQGIVYALLLLMLIHVRGYDAGYLYEQALLQIGVQPFHFIYKAFQLFIQGRL